MARTGVVVFAAVALLVVVANASRVPPPGISAEDAKIHAFIAEHKAKGACTKGYSIKNNVKMQRREGEASTRAGGWEGAVCHAHPGLGSGTTPCYLPRPRAASPPKPPSRARRF